jgi:hypothetical protein
MKDVLLTWDLPTDRVDGGELLPSDIRDVEVFISADQGQNFVPARTVLPTATQEAPFSQLEFGTWIFRFVVTDTNSKPSANLDFPVEVLDDSAPNTVQNVQVIIT